MKVGLIDVDGNNDKPSRKKRKIFPNLALMKISSYHKSLSDTVEWAIPTEHYDIVYMSKVFTFTPEYSIPLNADVVYKGGTGYGLDNKLPREVEHVYPDYSLYGIDDTAYGFLTRGCPRNCKFCIVGQKESLVSHKVADLSEFWRGQKNIKLLDPNILACKDRIELLKQLADSGAWVDFTQGLDIRLVNDDIINVLNYIRIKMIHFAWDNPKEDLREQFCKFSEKSKIKRYQNRAVYVLTNYDSTIEEDLFRIYELKRMNYNPYVMIYDKPNSPQIARDIQRWCNNRIIFESCPNFENYRRTS